MTKKEEILLFIEQNVTYTDFLECNEIIIDAPETSIVNIGDVGIKTIEGTKQQTIDYINEYYNDDLINIKENVINKITTWGITNE